MQNIKTSPPDVEIDFASRFPPRRLGAKKKVEIGPRDVEIRVRSVRFAPSGLEKKVKGNFAFFSVCGDLGVVAGF